MLNLALYGVPALAALLPSWLAVALVPTLMVAQRLLLGEEDKLSLGPLTLYPEDVLTTLLLAKWLISKARRPSAWEQSIFAVLGTWVTVNFLATLLAGVKFGEEHTLACLVSWARGVEEAALVPIMAQAIRSMRQARAAIAVLSVFLGCLVVIQFVNFAGASTGFVIGEVQGLEREEPRFFGPVGDSVGAVLLLGYLFCLCRWSIAAAAACAGGIVLTAGLGAIFSMVLGTILFLLACKHMTLPGTRSQRELRFVAGLGALSVAAVAFAEPMTTTLRDRLDGQHEESGSQRLATGRIATAMIGDNLLSGVGYMGFKLVVDRYGGGDYFDLSNPDGATANANNQFLQSLADAGIPGLLCLIGLVYAAARLFHHAASRVHDPWVAPFFWAAMLWLLAQMFGNLAATWLTPSAFVGRLLWISLGLALGVERVRACSRVPEWNASLRLVQGTGGSMS